MAVLFTSAGLVKPSSGPVGSVGLGRAAALDGAHKGGVNRYLGPVSKWESVGNDFDAPVVPSNHIQVKSRT